jgi:hypothetical protein
VHRYPGSRGDGLHDDSDAARALQQLGRVLHGLAYWPFHAGVNPVGLGVQTKEACTSRSAGRHSLEARRLLLLLLGDCMKNTTTNIDEERAGPLGDTADGETGLRNGEQGMSSGPGDTGDDAELDDDDDDDDELDDDDEEEDEDREV